MTQEFDIEQFKDRFRKIFGDKFALMRSEIMGPNHCSIIFNSSEIVCVSREQIEWVMDKTDSEFLEKFPNCWNLRDLSNKVDLLYKQLEESDDARCLYKGLVSAIKAAK